MISKSDAIITRFESGYQRNAVELQKASQSYERTIDHAIQQWKDDRRILLEILKQDHLNIPQSMIQRAEDSVSRVP